MAKTAWQKIGRKCQAIPLLYVCLSEATQIHVFKHQVTNQPQLSSLNLIRFQGFDGAVLWLGLAISRVGSMPCLLACTVARVATGRYSLRVKHQKRWLKPFRNQTFTGNNICPWFLIYICFESGLWSSTCSHVASFRALRQWITILQSVIMSYATWMHARDGWFVAVGLWNATRFGFNFGNSIIVRNFDMTFLIHFYEVSHSFGTILFPWKCSNSDALRPFTGPCCGSWVCHGLYASVVSWMSWNEAANDPMTCFGSRLVGLWFLRKDFLGQEIEIHRNSIMFHKVGRVMQQMQIFGNVSISSWVTLRQTWFISGNEQTPRATQ